MINADNVSVRVWQYALREILDLTTINYAIYDGDGLEIKRAGTSLIRKELICCLDDCHFNS